MFEQPSPKPVADRRLGETEVAKLYLGSVRGRLWVQVDVPERVAVAVQNPELGPRFGEFVDPPLPCPSQALGPVPGAAD